MRCTLSILLLAVMAVMATAVEASMLSDPMEYLVGKHRTYYRAHGEVGVTLLLPKEWADYSTLCWKFWNDKEVVYSGMTVQADIMAKFGDLLRDQRFRVFISDPSAMLGVGDEDARKCKEREFAGLKDLGEFYGRYARVKFETVGWEPGTYYLYLAFPKADKYHLFSEESIPFRVAEPLPEMIEALKNAPAATLKEWGLEEFPTLEETTGRGDRTRCTFDISFADGGRMSGVSLEGRPSQGRILGVFTANREYEMMAGTIEVDEVDGETVRTRSSSRFLRGLRTEDLRVEWVQKVRAGTQVQAKDLDTIKTAQTITSTIFVEPNDVVKQGKVSWLNDHDFIAYSRSRHGDQVDFVRKGNFAREMRVENGHIRAKKCGNIVNMLEVEITEHVTTTQMRECYAYIPECRAKKCRVIRLGAGGIPIVARATAERNDVETQGLWNGLAYIAGQWVRRPGRTSVDVDQSQQQQQETQQDQEVILNGDSGCN